MLKNEGAQARQTLLGLVKNRSSEDAMDWLSKVTTKNIGEIDWSQLTQHFDQKYLIAGFKERHEATLGTKYGDMPIGHWRVQHAAKVFLMSTLASLEAHGFQKLFDWYDRGETQTRKAALCAINLTDDEDVSAAMNLIHDAGRTYLDDLMTAAWCNHPFATQHLSDDEYRNAVLKALFCNLPLDGFLGLHDRADASLAKSLNDFADEREAAGRPVPDVLWPVLALYPPSGLVARLLGRLEHPLAEQRLVAARSLANAGDERTRSFLVERKEREDDPQVIKAIERALSLLDAQSKS